MLKEFYDGGRIIFHLGLLENHVTGKYDIVSNIPSQIFERNSKELQEVRVLSKIFPTSQEQYLKEVASVIQKDEWARLFFYPQYLFKNSDKPLSDTFDELFVISQGFVLMPGNYYSWFNMPGRFYILNQKFTLAKLFYPEEFQLIKSTNRMAFEKSLPNEQSQKEYVELFAADNKYLSYQDDEVELLFLMTHKQLRMVTLVPL